jgi:hypothetical protein
MAAAGVVLRAGREAGAAEIAVGLPREAASAAGINEAGAGNHGMRAKARDKTRAFMTTPVPSP